MHTITSMDDLTPLIGRHLGTSDGRVYWSKIAKNASRLTHNTLRAKPGLGIEIAYIQVVLTAALSELNYEIT